MYITEAAAQIAALHGTGLSLMLTSAPGMGKSTVVRDVARALSAQLAARGENVVFHDTRDPLVDAELPKGARLFLFHTRILSTFDAPDVRGFMMPARSPDGELTSAFTWPDVFPSRALLARARGVVILLDEFMQADHGVQKAAANILLEQSIGSACLANEVPDDCGISIIAAANRTNDRSGVQRELAFVTNRMGILEVEFNVKALSAWMARNRFHPIGSAFLEKNPDVICRQVPDAPGPFCTPRSFCAGLTALARLVHHETPDVLPTTGLAVEVLAAFIGKGPAAQFAAFAKYASELPERADVLSNPTTATVPARPDSRFITANYIGRWMAEDHTDAAKITAYLKYIDRLPPDLQIMTVRTVGSECPSVMANPAFAPWATKNAAVVRATFSL